jgi:hypothetical protein
VIDAGFALLEKLSPVLGKVIEAVASLTHRVEPAFPSHTRQDAAGRSLGDTERLKKLDKAPHPDRPWPVEEKVTEQRENEVLRASCRHVLRPLSYRTLYTIVYLVQYTDHVNNLRNDLSEYCRVGCPRRHGSGRS